MLDTVISVKRTRFRMDDPRSSEADAKFRSIRPTILKRDNHTCQFCGLRCESLQEIHHINGEHDNSSDDNLVTSCIMCHMVHHIGFVGLNKMGMLIRLPDVSQADLNHILRTLWLGENARVVSIRDQSIAILRALETCSVGAKQLLGYTDPQLLGEYLLQLDDTLYGRRDQVLKDIRILYHRDPFEEHLNVWEGIYSGYPITKWERFAKEFSARST